MRYPGAFALVLIALGLAGDPALAATESPAIVEVAEVTRGSGTAVMKLPGTVLSKQDAQISAEVTGRLVWVAEVDGDRRVIRQVSAGRIGALPDVHRTGRLEIGKVSVAVVVDDVVTRGELIEPGATIQMGIGGIPDAVYASMEGLLDLGIQPTALEPALVRYLGGRAAA